MRSNIDVEASSGNVTLQVENKDMDAEWQLQSNSGKRSVALPFDQDVFTNRKTSGQTGKGTYSVNIKTSSGNIIVE
ncbi:DUF4097 family beta strand repeat-containing protein [Paenibacillus urinalis]|uniref:DUF4097 family beta strand repeat-containing protein n=1 Tax=Paenibacillus urinalis TaxID=521520 RepID=UPI001960DCDB